MKWLVEKSRYLALIGVFGLLVGAITAFCWGIYKTLKTIESALSNYDKEEFTLVSLFGSLDSFLIAIALLVLSVSIYELFIGGLEVPDWMTVHDLSELKAKFSLVIIPVMAVKFLQKLISSENALETLYYGIAVALVTTSLTIFNYVSEKEKEAELERHPEAEETRAEDLEK